MLDYLFVYFPLLIFTPISIQALRLVIQAIIASIVAVGAYISIYFRKLKEFISKIFKKKK